MNNNQRSFKAKLNKEDTTFGRYTGESPYQAANKALSEIIRQRKKDGENTSSKINFWLVESTKGKKYKEHQYVGKRVKLPTPIEYEVGSGNYITKEYKNELTKIKKNNEKI